jgi:hypothetical protein
MKLLSPRPFAEFNPEEYKIHVRSLYYRPVKKVRVAKKPATYSCRVTPKGSLSITVRRKPKFLTHAEVAEIETKTGRPANEIATYLTKRKIPIESPK